MTETGKQLLAQCRQRAKTIEQRLLAGLSSEEEKTIRRWLVSLAVDDVAAG